MSFNIVKQLNAEDQEPKSTEEQAAATPNTPETNEEKSPEVVEPISVENHESDEKTEQVGGSTETSSPDETETSAEAPKAEAAPVQETDRMMISTGAAISGMLQLIRRRKRNATIRFTTTLLSKLPTGK